MENNNNLLELKNFLHKDNENGGKIKDDIFRAINETDAILKTNKINIVFIGSYNAGKTSMINSVIASITNNYENVQLISSKCENSYFPIIVEKSSDDDYYQMKISRSDKTPDEEIKCLNPEEINTRLEEMDKESLEYLKCFDKFDQDTNDDKKKIDHHEKEKKRKELEYKIPNILIKIGIPKFHPDLRLIDAPGLTTNSMTERLFKVLNENYLLSIFVYLKSFTQDKVTDNGMICKFFKEIKENYNNSIFCVCLTKYDQFF